MNPTLVAIAHLIGAVLAYFVLGIAAGMGWVLWQQRIRQKSYEELSGRFNIPASQVQSEDDENSPRMLQYFAERSSSELLRNRLSDFCGVLLVAWNILGLVATLGWFLLIAWSTFTENKNDANQVWWLFAINLVFVLIAIAFWGICRLLFGRYPGEARRLRKYLAQVVKARSM
jgi:hypothetical protein